MAEQNYKTDLQCVYDSIAHHFSKTRHFIWPEMELFLPVIKPGGHLIDIGCGNGRLLRMLQEKQCTYVGIDQSAELIKEAQRQWPNYAFEVADMSTYHYGRDRFDTACLIASLHHLATNDEQQKTLERIFTALKSGGYLCITVWNMWQSRYRKYVLKEPYHHSYIPYQDGMKTAQRFYYAFTKTELITITKAAGFEIVSCWYSDKATISDRKQGRNLCLIAKKPL